MSSRPDKHLIFTEGCADSLLAEPQSVALDGVRKSGRKVAAVVMNKTEQKIAYYLWVDGNAAEVESLPHSIQTLVF